MFQTTNLYHYHCLSRKNFSQENFFFFFFWPFLSSPHFQVLTFCAPALTARLVFPRASLQTCLDRFLHGSDSYRADRLKLIPRIAVGPWFVQKTVGATPAILGKKITTSFHADPLGRYFEIDVDVHSSKMAGYVLQVLRSSCKNVVLDIYFAIEGQDPVRSAAQRSERPAGRGRGGGER